MFFCAIESPMQRIFVSGGAGFIGSHLVERLVQEGKDVVVLDLLLQGNKIPTHVLEKITFHRGDVTDEKLVTELMEGCDAVIHLAAVLGVDIVAENPILTMETETNGAIAIAHAMKKHGISTLLYASTSGIYDFHPTQGPMHENLLVDPKSSYASAKRYVEKYFETWAKEYSWNVSAVRFFNIYGPRQDERMVIPRFLKQCLTNQPLTIYGDGTQIRDFTYVKDATEACYRLLQKVKGFEIVNVCNEEAISINQLAHTIKQLIESYQPTLQVKIAHVPPPPKRLTYESPYRQGSAQKLLQLTGAKPSTPLEEGLKETLQFFLEKYPS